MNQKLWQAEVLLREYAAEQHALRIDTNSRDRAAAAEAAADAVFRLRLLDAEHAAGEPNNFIKPLPDPMVFKGNQPQAGG